MSARDSFTGAGARDSVTGASARDSVIVTCEHASARVPAAYRSLFVHAAADLASHRGHDIGTRPIAVRLARHLRAPLFLGRSTRLLVDLNRSRRHPRVFSEYTRDLGPADKARILAQQYQPYRDQVTRAITDQVERGHRVVHISVHSFTPSLGGLVRRADIGLLYDPARTWESALARAWQRALERDAPDLRVRRNYPYRGNADGFTTSLRRLFDDGRYAGIELECNQALTTNPRQRRRLAGLFESLLGDLAR